MDNEKNILPITNSWPQAVASILENGLANVQTSGGEVWNKSVATQLTEKSGKKVLYVGLSPDYNIVDNLVYKFVIEANTNREAVSLLSPTND